MRILVALGGNALLRRGEAPSFAVQQQNIRRAVAGLARIVRQHQTIITHGNGPQIGQLANRAASGEDPAAEPLDVLGAETEGMIGYLIEQELANQLPPGWPLATLLTMVEVDPHDPAFEQPTKFIGPGYSARQAKQLEVVRGWQFAREGDRWRRVVASPRPQRVIELAPIRLLVEQGVTLICAGGGGVPVARVGELPLPMRGVEAVIDKDHCSGLLARELAADLLVMLTDVPGVFEDWDGAREKQFARLTPREVDACVFPAGSMGPKVAAAAEFVRATGQPAAIGALEDLEAIIAGDSGTWIAREFRAGR